MVQRKEYLDQLKKWKDEQVIKVITGIRRCGKSTLLELYQDYLKSLGVDEDQIIFINFEELEFFAEMMDTPYIKSTFWFDAHYAVFALVLLVCALLIHNFFWKHSLMREEGRLIEEGKRV